MSSPVHSVGAFPPVEKEKPVVSFSKEPQTGWVPPQGVSQRIRPSAKFFFQGGRKYFVKGVTYGPFAPRDGVHFPERRRAREDLDQMRRAGINVVRLYHSPPAWFLDECEETRLKALITIPWEQHINFLGDRNKQRSIRRQISGAVASGQGHPAVFAYAVGNEIPGGMARWHGSRKMERFIESLVDVGRQADPHSLYTYANYPPTEYLLPSSVDFYCYNVYLHRQADFQRYLARLQNLAGEKPLVLGEFGLDVARHSEEEQAQTLRWHIETVSRMGLAGTVLFSWTDEWFTGGHPVEDWKFGLVDAQRRPRKAFFEVQRLFKDTHRIPLKRYPSISVVVCSYNGGRTLEACLTSLLQMDYPDYEVILVDDGSTDDTPRIAVEFPAVKTIRRGHLGLSAARNVGMRAARGEIVAYTDSDCVADKDWLYYLAGTLEQGDCMAVGGPNLSPPARNWEQACVAASPGQPSHVLMDDSEAEHIPGCNMAFYKRALESIGGFDPEYRKAGDDVDVCWRLVGQGYRIGFSPSAVVWHHRRFSVRAYFRQQEGYGEAEALLRFKHLVRFGPTGSAKWRGQVYGGGHFSFLPHRPIVYHGVFGMGLFQCVYPKRASDFVQLMSSLEWNAFALILTLFAIQTHQGWYVPAALWLCAFGAGAFHGLRARIEAPYRGLGSRALVALLAILQPLWRGWARYRTWMRKKRTPADVFGATPDMRLRKTAWDPPDVISFWSEKNTGREQFLEAIGARLNRDGWRYSPDTGWTDWDYQIYGNRWWQLRLLTMTEEHGDGKRLTRARLRPSPTTFSRLVGIVVGVISLLAFQKFWMETTPEGFQMIGIWFCAVSLWLTYLTLRSARFRRRITRLVELAAEDCSLTAIHGPR